MLHENVLMADIDVDQWRNAQALLLRSAKAARRLVVIHDHGKVVKFRHTAGAAVNGRVDVVTDPHVLARELYAANRGLVDFVVVMERNAVDCYFATVQNAWSIDDDLDTYVHDTYATLDAFADEIVTYPGSARSTLGLQWKLGATYDELVGAVHAYVDPGSTAILGVEAAGELWTSLILDFDPDLRITSITTADPSVVDIRGTVAQLAENLAEWAEGTGKTVSLALVLQQEAARSFLAAEGPEEKLGILSGALSTGNAAASRGDLRKPVAVPRDR
ncbi:hypothetical protein AB0E69_07875 [Kribbella sp. NPDC026611]|uniref:hypothetical protein n=1 Tax=Kribbella sp. NPDC026611 TaxID=3154911 RepID=UPI0033E9ED2E